MITWSRPPSAKHRAVLSARLVMPAMIADSCSAPARSSVLDIAISNPSEETATASVTPGVDSTKLDNNQLKLRTSALFSVAGFAWLPNLNVPPFDHRSPLLRGPVPRRSGRRRRTRGDLHRRPSVRPALPTPSFLQARS